MLCSKIVFKLTSLNNFSIQFCTNLFLSNLTKVKFLIIHEIIKKTIDNEIKSISRLIREKIC